MSARSHPCIHVHVHAEESVACFDTKSIVHKRTVEFTLGGKTCDFHLALDDPQFNGMRFSHALRDAMHLLGTDARSGIWLFVAWAKVGRDRACHAQFMNLRAGLFYFHKFAI